MKNILCSRNINIALRTRLLQCYIWPIVLYGCEAWTIKEDLKRRIEAFEMWTYRRILHQLDPKRKRRVGGRKKSWLRNIRQWTGIAKAAHQFRLARRREHWTKLIADLH
ncbi:hypothetical protein ACJJTC_002163 [Scirpophaga incertulas]